MSRRAPDILFIVLDTLRRDRLSAYGHPVETSPHFDSFAAGATLFERAVAPAQWTIPSHASMFTGLPASTHGLTQADQALSPAYGTLAELLRTSGYYTVAFCNNPLVGVLNNGLQRGFERFYNYASAAPFRPTESEAGRLRRAALRLFRRHLARPLGNQFARSDWLFRVSLNPLFVPLWTRLINYKGHTAHSIDDLIACLNQHWAGGADRPLFAFLNLMGAHLPYNPPQDALDRVAPGLRRSHASYAFMRRFNSEAARWASPAEPPLTEWEQETLHHFYDAEISHQDAQLGRLFRSLEQSGALEHTLVVLVADHGEGHGDHGFFGHGFVVHQELVQVPLVIRWPEQFLPGARLSQPVSTRRLFHTVLEAAGVRAPADDAGHLSLARFAAGQDDPEGGQAFSEAFPPLTFINVIRHRRPELISALNLFGIRRALYDGDHKLLVVDGEAEGLFDLGADPAEQHNLADAQPGRVEDMLHRLSALVSQAESRPLQGNAAGAAADSVVDHLRALGYIE